MKNGLQPLNVKLCVGLGSLLAIFGWQGGRLDRRLRPRRARSGQEGIEALVQRIGLAVELGGGRQYVVGQRARAVGGLAGAGDVDRDFAGAGGCTLRALRRWLILAPRRRRRSWWQWR